jgi:hypothetical protein
MSLVKEAGAREQVSASLVNGERQDAWFVVEGGLDTIAMVRIEVQIQHACLAFAQGGGNCDSRVVVNAKTGGAGRQGVVEPTSWMESVLEATVEHPT